MAKKHISRIKQILNLHGCGRALNVFPDDVFIVSYPKSGNTWARFLIANLTFKDDSISFENIETKIPDIYQNTCKKIGKIQRPRYLKSHEYFNPLYKKVIYIVRDPRDVVISYFHHFVKLGRIDEDSSLDKFVLKFIRGEIDSFGSWRENVGSWLGARNKTEDFLTLKYEDMLSNTMCELEKISFFLELNSTKEHLSQCIELSSFDIMRKLETTQNAKWKPIRKSRKDKAFVRSGIAGGWKNCLSYESVKLIEYAWGEQMKSLGYL